MHITGTVTDSLLSFYGKKEGGREIIYLSDACFPFGFTVVFQVSMRKTNEPPDESKNKPAEREGHGEYKQVPAPFNVD